MNSHTLLPVYTLILVYISYYKIIANIIHIIKRYKYVWSPPIRIVCKKLATFYHLSIYINMLLYNIILFLEYIYIYIYIYIINILIDYNINFNRNNYQRL